MDINILFHLFLALIPTYPILVTHHLPNLIQWTPLIARAYQNLGIDFVRRHTFITAGMLTTGAIHLAHVVWAYSGEPLLALDLVILTGYALLLVGLVRAFIHGQGTVREQNP